MYDLNPAVFTYTGAMAPRRGGFSRRQHIAGCIVGFAFGAVMAAAAIL